MRHACQIIQIKSAQGNISSANSETYVKRIDLISMQKSEFAVRNEDFALSTNERYEVEHY
jgi:hypothetical protein